MVRFPFGIGNGNAPARVVDSPKDLVRTWWALTHDPLRFFIEGTARYGSTWRFRLGRTPFTLLGDADAVKIVLQERAPDFTKRFAYEKVRPVLGNGLLTSEGDVWLRQRRLLQPTFHEKRMVEFAEAMVRITSDFLDEWAKHEGPLDVSQQMMTLTLRIVGSVLFGVDVRADTSGIGAAMTVLIEEANRRVMALAGVRERLPSSRNRAFVRAQTFLDELVNRMIDERESKLDGARSDLLTDLVRLRYEDGDRMSRAQIRDEVITLLVAGHETTACVLGWTFYLLSRHPEAWRRVASEVDSACQGRTIRHDDIASLPYTRMVINEAMRLYPPGWILVRYAERAAVLSGHEIPAGSVVAICPYLIHRDTRYWDNPEGFDPERFANETNRFAYLPWSAGPRVCIGKAFATMEMLLVVASIVQRFRLDLVPTRPVEVSAQLTLRPRDGIWMHARTR